MASEVVCGLIFRLLLPICLTVGEYGPRTEVTCESEGGAQGRGRAPEQSQVKWSSALGLGSEVRAAVLRSVVSDSRCPECHSTVLSLPALECTLGVSLNCPAAEPGRPGRRVLKNVCVEFNLTWNFFRGVLTCTQRMPILLEGGCRPPPQVRCRGVPESPPPLVPRCTAHGAYKSDTCLLSLVSQNCDRRRPRLF